MDDGDVTGSMGGAPTGGESGRDADAGTPHRSDSNAAREIPARLGRYTIKRVLGEGGMGTVYLAEQENPRREVALKVIRAGYLAPELLRRFELESQVLGRLQHPGIAQIYEAGVFQSDTSHADTSHADDESSSRRASSSPSVTSSLRHSVTSSSPIPFFAMEFVKGVPLTDYADSHRLGVRQRLELLAKVCDAVYHAHQKGVIHRDLKPSNILVVDDSPTSPSVAPSLRHSLTSPVGQPKILDFGVARATDSDIQQTTMQTDVGQLIGTVPYMSPEQVTGDPFELDTRSDVYALGVIAYELLAGRLPHDLRRKMIHEAARIVREEEPTRLSAIDRTLHGDVETIVAKALEKAKTRRYQSAESLASDIRRYLKDEPIAARPASTWYQASKFARRNRGLVIGLAASFVLLIAGVIGTSIGLGQAVRARDAESVARKEADTQRDAAVAAKTEEEKQRKVAETQRDKAEKIADFMSDVLEGAGPSVALGRDTTMLAEMMDAAAGRIERGELKDSPEADLRLRLTLGNVYNDLGRYTEADRMLTYALDAATSAAGSDHSFTAACLNALGILRMHQGRSEESLGLSRRSFEMFERLPGCEVEAAATIANVAAALAIVGRSAEAEPLFVEAIARHRACGLGEDAGLAMLLGKLGAARSLLGRSQEAEADLRQAVSLAERLLPPMHPELVRMRMNLANAIRASGRSAEAVPFLERAVRDAESIYPGGHRETASAIVNLSNAYVEIGRPGDALTAAQRAITMLDRLFEGDHPDKAFALTAHAAARRDLGRTEEAEREYREALAMLEKLGTGAERETANCLEQLARIARNAGKPDEAVLLLERSLLVRRRLGAEDRADVENCLSQLGSALGDAGRHQEAYERHEQSLRMSERLYPSDHESVAGNLHNLASECAKIGRLSEAEELDGRAAAMYERLAPGDNVDLARSLFHLAYVRMLQKRFGEAEPLLDRALTIRRRLLPADHKDMVMSLTGLGMARQALGHAAEASPLYEEALAISRELHPGDHPDVVQCLLNLAKCRLLAGNDEGALGPIEEGVTMASRVLPQGDATRKKCEDLLSEVRMAIDSHDRPSVGAE